MLSGELLSTPVGFYPIYPRVFDIGARNAAACVGYCCKGLVRVSAQI